eukprot:1614750-Pyramimonas_sp.AAC.1
MCPPHPVLRFAAPWGAPPKAPAAVSTCVFSAQRSPAWRHGEGPPARPVAVSTTAVLTTAYER